MTTVNVSSASALTAALKTAVSGETIQLSAGNYSGVTISGLSFASDVTITSSSLASKATLVGLTLANSSGITFQNINLSTVGVADPYYAFRVSNSSNITFTGADVHGSAAIAPGSQTSGFLIQGGSNVSIVNSTFENMNNGIAAENGSAYNFSNNTFSNLSKGGIQAGQVNGLTLSGNYFTNFNTAAGVHSDAIQLFTAGTTQASQNIVITDNTYVRGTGSAAQGIYLNDEVGTLAYKNVLITGNQMLGADWNSVYLSHASGTVNVSNNYVASWTGLDVVSGSIVSNMQGRIDLGDLSAATLTEVGNTAQAYELNGKSVATPALNSLLAVIAPVTSLAAVAVPVTTVAAAASVSEHMATSGSLLTGATGGTLTLSAVGSGAAAQHAVAASGTTLTGTYGTLTVQQDGAYAYTETKDALIGGQTYTDHFTTTVSNQSGQAATSTLDVTVLGTTTGNGSVNTLTAGAGNQTISNFGPTSTLTGGSGMTTFDYTSIAQSTPTNQTRIQNFLAGDIIDLSAVDPKFHIVKAFDGHPDELVITHLGTGGAWGIYGDTTGSGHANFQIYITSGTSSVTAANFHL